MWIRSAFWEGKFRPGQERAFVAEIETDIVPAMRGLPGVKDVKALWPKAYEDRSTDIVCQLLVFFANQSDIALMISSDARNAVAQSALPIELALFRRANQPHQL